MTDNERKLLEEHGVLVLPRVISHEVYGLVVEACAIMRGRPFKLHCHGDGGDTSTALGIVDIIRAHGQVTGELAGEANSSSGVIFAGCSHRTIHPHGSIGVHGVTMDQLNTVDSAYARTWLNEIDATNALIAHVYADASNLPYAQWLEIIMRQGGQGYTRIPSSVLVGYALAIPIDQARRKERDERFKGVRTMIESK